MCFSLYQGVQIKRERANSIVHEVVYIGYVHVGRLLSIVSLAGLGTCINKGHILGV